MKLNLEEMVQEKHTWRPDKTNGDTTIQPTVEVKNDRSFKFALDANA